MIVAGPRHPFIWLQGDSFSGWRSLTGWIISQCSRQRGCEVESRRTSARSGYMKPARNRGSCLCGRWHCRGLERRAPSLVRRDRDSPCWDCYGLWWSSARDPPRINTGRSGYLGHCYCDGYISCYSGGWDRNQRFHILDAFCNWA